MNLTIKQSATLTENLSSPNVVEALYQLTKPGPMTGLPSADAVLVGRIQVPAAYEDAVSFLNTQFSVANSDNGSDFQVTVLNNNYYIRFADTEAERVLKSNMGKGEGEGITVAEAATKSLPNNLFYNNTTIERFDEFKYFKQNDVGGAIVRNCTNLTSIDLTNLIKLPNWLCGGCTNLTHFHGINGPEHTLNLVNLTQTVSNNAGCFDGCLGLKYVTSLGAIPYLYSVFSNCTNLETVVLPITCIALHGNTFKNCTKLSTINLSHLTTISGPAFEGDSSLEYCDGEGSVQGVLYLPNLTGTLGNTAFKGCTKLISVTSLGSITSIGNNAFENCVNLATINIPNTVTSVGGGAFNNTAWYNSQSDGPITINSCVLYSYKGGIVGSYVIPNNISYITDGALSSKSSLTSITLGSGVNYIGKGAFQYDDNLSTIVVDSTNGTYDSRDNCNAVIETASNTLIAGCKNTIIPNTVTKIGGGAFEHLSNLTSIVVPDSVTTIEHSAFSRGGLTNVELGTGITNLGRQVFFATSLQTLTVKAIVPPQCANADTLSISSSCIIYVPAASVDAYKAANIWKDHASKIQAIPTT